jgi:hypothetical protein
MISHLYCYDPVGSSIITQEQPDDSPHRHAGNGPLYENLPGITLITAWDFTGSTIKTAKTAAKNITMKGKTLVRFLMVNLLFFKLYLMTGFLFLTI